MVSHAKLLETSLGLWTGGPAASRHRCHQRARGGESKERYALDRIERESLEKLVLDVFLVVDHDYDLKSRCSPGRFGEIAIANLSVHGGRTQFRRAQTCSQSAGA